MAVPKRKKSKSRRNMRRASNGTYVTESVSTPVVDKRTGEYRLPHRISEDGYYNGIKILPDKKKKEEEVAEAA